ncbi:GtrA family protein [Ligilactobacillus sp. WILCCON 0076]|uniref:GtrA family protein n=1 Tax=Ligilactobacillus ubinensis TaxID=2876789 RepID=A0A9X2FKV5_9LACO|nr:GtrA family protein [Ligilactobacillus ubinensis]MCP0886581.1 GtrA family protein [Ligilactobacillus ubinensis]
MEERGKTEFIRTLKYFTFATSAGIVEIGTFTILTQLTGLHYWERYLIALILSVIWNFTLNRRFTFKSNNNILVAMTKVFVYYLVFTPTSTLLGNYLVTTLQWNQYLVTIMNLLLNGITEYLYQRLVVFGRSIDSRNISVENTPDLNNQL